MLDKVSNKVLCFLTGNNELDEEKREILLFGIKRIIEDIPKTIGLVLIGFILNILYEMLIVTVILTLYKTFVGGVHAKTNFMCFISSTVFYLAIIYSAKYIITAGITRFFLLSIDYIFATYCIWVYVPADVPEIPKVNKELRKSTKIKAFIVLNLIYITTLLIIKDLYIQRLIMYSVFYINLMTTRTMYKLFKNEYGFEVYIPEQ
ncbi:MAG: accessory gene regulator B family protein [Clostridia bacterium]|nr:accessory gene regulator B family protein [Clostridia bacterium]